MKELVHILKNTRQHLMTGVSHMIPFVVSGGILLAVSVMLYGKGAVPDAATDPNLKNSLISAWRVNADGAIPRRLYRLFHCRTRRAGSLCNCRPGGQQLRCRVLWRDYRRDFRWDCRLVPEKLPVPKVLRSVMPIFIIPIIGTFITAGIMMWGWASL